jgi:hypothetical protein
MVIILKAAILKNFAFLDVTQFSLAENVSAIEFQVYTVSLHVVKSYRGVKVQLHAFSALSGDEWLGLRPDNFTPWRERLVPFC